MKKTISKFTLVLSCLMTVGLSLDGKSIEIDGRISSELYLWTQGDLKHISSFPGRETFDLVLANPPFHAPRDGRINPDREKAVARHELRANLTDFVRAAEYLLRNSGRLNIIYPAAKLSELALRLRKHHLELKRVRPVYSRKGESGVFVLAEARKRTGVELEILPPLYLFRKGGGYTAEVEKIVNGTWFRGGRDAPGR